MNKVFSQVWEQLRGKKASLPDYLESVVIRNLRGIAELTVNLDFPVTVISGANASGKTTVLFSIASAYKVNGMSTRNFTPSSIFPDLKLSNDPELSDSQADTELEFYYKSNGAKLQMAWRKGKSWNKSFFGRKGVAQPKRDVYLRTLSNLTNPSEVRSMLQISRKLQHPNHLPASLIAFAQNVLPLNYQNVYEIKTKPDKSLLIAVCNNDLGNITYSEFHMSAGERAILRLSKDLSELKNALVLIDEIEAGLHPYTQQQLMLELQRIALRNNLQIIVTSHSPVVIESVPIEGRIFLERENNNVSVKTAYRDIIQKALYGESLEKLNILCEDTVAESFILGVLDDTYPRLGLIPSDIIVGKDTSKNSFPHHVEAVAKFKGLDSFIFVLDGDAKDLENKIKETGSRFGASVNPLFLPGSIPEQWCWEAMENDNTFYAGLFNMNVTDFKQAINAQNLAFNNATDTKTNIIKNKADSFANTIKRTTKEVVRMVVKSEIDRGNFEIKKFQEKLEAEIIRWQARQ